MKKTVLLLAAVVALSGGASGKSSISDRLTIKEYRINGVSMAVKRYSSDLLPGNFIGEKIYNARQAGLKVTDGRDARGMAKMFMGEKRDYDCVFVGEKNNHGILYMAAARGKGSAIEEADIPPSCKDCGTAKWRKDGFPEFPGSNWILSIEFVYTDESTNFSNFFTTKKTDMAAIKSHYKNYAGRSGWTVFGENGDSKEYYIILVKRDGFRVVMIKRTEGGKYSVNITG